MGGMGVGGVSIECVCEIPSDTEPPAATAWCVTDAISGDGHRVRLPEEGQEDQVSIVGSEVEMLP